MGYNIITEDIRNNGREIQNSPNTDFSALLVTSSKL